MAIPLAGNPSATCTIYASENTNGLEGGQALVRQTAKRILIIEDDRDLSAMLRHLLEHRGYVVEVAYDGTSGRALIHQHTPDLVIVDIMLPGLNGYMLVAELTQKPADSRPKLFVLTGITQDDSHSDSEWRMKLGVDAFLTKPAAPETIVGIVEPLLARSSETHRA